MNPLISYSNMYTHSLHFYCTQHVISLTSTHLIASIHINHMVYITSYYLTHVKTASIHTSSHGSKHAYSSYHVHILNSFHKHSWIFTYKVEDSCCVDEERFFEMSVHLSCPCYNTSNLLKDNIAWIFFFFFFFGVFSFQFLISQRSKNIEK